MDGLYHFCCPTLKAFNAHYCMCVLAVHCSLLFFVLSCVFAAPASYLQPHSELQNRRQKRGLFTIIAVAAFVLCKKGVICSEYSKIALLLLLSLLSYDFLITIYYEKVDVVICPVVVYILSRIGSIGTY